jgi:hypothetical protein
VENQFGRGIWHPMWSSDGRFLALRQSARLTHRLQVLDLRDGRTLNVWPPPGEEPGSSAGAKSATFLPGTGCLLLEAQPRGRYLVWDASKPEAAPVPFGSGAQPRMPIGAWSTGGRTLIVGYRDDRISLLEVDPASIPCSGLRTP